MKTLFLFSNCLILQWHYKPAEQTFLTCAPIHLTEVGNTLLKNSFQPHHTRFIYYTQFILSCSCIMAYRMGCFIFVTTFEGLWFFSTSFKPATAMKIIHYVALGHLGQAAAVYSGTFAALRNYWMTNNINLYMKRGWVYLLQCSVLPMEAKIYIS